jgi:hypothetical protein
VRDYGKVHSTFWSSGTTGGLSDDAKILALYLLTCSHSTIAGVFRLPDGYACEDLSWDAARVRKGFVELLAKGFANRCETTKWVFICRHFEWNKPENPNQWKSAAKIASQVPNECSWAIEFKKVFAIASGAAPSEPPNRSETLPKPEAVTGAEAEAGSVTEELTSLSESVDSNRCPVNEIIEVFKVSCPSMPRPRIVPDAVKAQISSRWRQSPKHQSLEFWKGYFEYCERNNFLAGRAPGRNGGKPFRASLEWLVTAGNFAKVINENYEDAMA